MGISLVAFLAASLANDGHVSASTQNQAFNALLFLYNVVVSKKIGLIESRRQFRVRTQGFLKTQKQLSAFVGLRDGDSFTNHRLHCKSSPSDLDANRSSRKNAVLYGTR
jgi:Phage integrase, N-terminal SAM-like domain